MTKIYLFPGQGSQSVGMGEGLFEQFPDLTAQADEILGYSLRQLCLEDPRDELGQTQFTQPALYAVTALSYLAKLAETDGQPPAFVAGHSLGEYNALFAAGAFDFATGLKLVQRRGAIMSKAEGGGMAAILMMPPGEIRMALDAAGFDTIDIANYNSPRQTVISGRKEDVEAAAPKLEEAGAKRVIVLNVSGAFHSRYMSDAAAEFGAYVNDFSFQPLQIPVIANITGEPYEQDKIAESLTSQICQSVRWTDTILRLKQEPEAEFEEIGPGKVLTGLTRQIK